MLNDYFDIYSMQAIVEDLTFFDQNAPSTPSVIKPLSEILDQYNQVSFIPCSIYKEDLIKYLVLQIEQTFGFHEIYKSTNANYSNFIKAVDKSMIKEELIT